MLTCEAVTLREGRCSQQTQQLRYNAVSIIGCAFGPALTRRHRALKKNLRTHFYLVVLYLCNDAHWTITITLQTSQKISLRLQTKQRSTIVYGIDNRLCALIVDANLKGDDSLTSCRQKNLV
jgi:hypothetical protein